MRALINLSISMTFIALCVAGCGGGSGGNFVANSSSSSSSSNSSSSSSSSSSGSSCVASGGTNSGTANVAVAVVDQGPACAQVQGQGQVNILYTTVVICAPGSTTNCQTIDHVQVDTASYGLRIVSEALQPSLAAALPVVTQSGQTIAECTQFADGYSWGPIRTADMQIAGEKASGLEIQVIGDPAYSQVPNGCTSYGTQEDTVADFGANGIIGVGPFVQDCGATPPGGQGGCTGDMNNGFYYTCASSGATCTPAEVSLAQQMSNPVAFFATDNNGVIIQLPQLASGGQPTAQGSLIFGIDTQANNAMMAQTVLPTDPSTGEITTVFNNGTADVTLPASVIDSGSNAYYFQSTLPPCTNNSGFYCPSSESQLNASNQGYQSTTQYPLSFYVANADNLSAANSAFDDLAGCPVSSGGSGGSGGSSQCSTSSQAFDWGLPFFFGRSVYTVIACGQQGASCATTSKGYGPYVAY